MPFGLAAKREDWMLTKADCDNEDDTPLCESGVLLQVREDTRRSLCCYDFRDLFVIWMLPLYVTDLSLMTLAVDGTHQTCSAPYFVPLAL
jgi:hypothetical protein